MIEVHHERRAGVAILRLDRPVANALVPSLRAELSAALEACFTDNEVQAIVLHGAGSGFSGGVDITEYGDALQSPWISDLCLQIENAPKPVVAALHGFARGAGFELALAAHKRVAAIGTQVALPEVRLGLPPGGGTTQRLPRMAGAKVALELLLSGRVLDAADPRLGKIIDRIVPAAPLDGAVSLARELAEAGRWLRARDLSAGFSDPASYQSSVAGMMARLRNRDSVEGDILRCVEAAQLLPYERGLEMERSCFEDRRNAPEARARRHILAAERRARIMPERSVGGAAEVSDVVVPGSSALVVELVKLCLDTGLRVTLLAEDGTGAEAVRNRVGEIFDKAVADDAMSVEASDALMLNLIVMPSVDALARADLVLDTGEIDLRAHCGVLNPEAIWVSILTDGPVPVTVPRNIDGRHVEVRVYRPVTQSALVELCVPPGATADAVVTVAELFNRMGRTVIRCECVEGLVGGNMSAALYGAALALVGAGANPYRIDAAARAMGFARGPFQLMDVEGLQGVAARLTARAAGGGAVDPGLLAGRIAAGALGRAAGRGFYLYGETGIEPDASLQPVAGEAGRWPDERLGAALLAAMANEAARLLTAPVVQRASDIDVVMVNAFGFAPGRGGPLFQADLAGLFNVMREMQHCAPLSAALWQPHQMIRERVKNGDGFFGRVA